MPIPHRLNGPSIIMCFFIANHVIESKSDIKEGTEEEINQLVGEAYMLRAYVHFLIGKSLLDSPILRRELWIPNRYR